MKSIKHNLLWIILIVVSLLSLNRCEYPFQKTSVVEDLLIGEYFEAHPDTFSVLAEVLTKTHNMAFLKAYGEFTCFAPTNEAFREFFIAKNVPGINESSNKEALKNAINNFDNDYLHDLVRFWVIKGDTLATSDFIESRLNTPNLYGQYLTYKTTAKDGQIVGVINKTADIDEGDVRLLNGIVHSLKSVIEPERLTIAEYMEQLDGYDIFNEALKETGLYDVLNVPVNPENDTTWYTFFATPDSILIADGITGIDSIKARYQSKTISADSALYAYMAYHILNNQYYFMADLVSAQAASTLAPSEVITIKQLGTTVLVNDDEFAGVHEPGFEIDIPHSDLTVDNGVIHFMDGNFFVKARYPFAVYWEVTDQSELKKIPGVYQKKGLNGLVNGQFEDISWYPEELTINYHYGPFNGELGLVHRDCFDFYLRPAVIQSIKFKTPILVKGSYKVWICMRVQTANVATKNAFFNVYFNGEQTTKVVNNRLGYGSGASGTSDGELNLVDTKIYQYDPTRYQPADSTDEAVQAVIDYGISKNWIGDKRFNSNYAGTVIVTETGRQTIEFVAISGGVNAQVWLDQIHFIPAEEEQNWPRINWQDGTRVYKEDLEAGIFPPSR